MMQGLGELATWLLSAFRDPDGSIDYLKEVSLTATSSAFVMSGGSWVSFQETER